MATEVKRYLSLDFLRGLSIFGMVFCAIIPHGVLPAWMYHIQNPPPTHELDMTIAGLSWVDMVFPIFIFCMGAAIPLSGKTKIAKGITTGEYMFQCFKRFVMLWLFSYLYVLLNFTRTVQPNGEPNSIVLTSALTLLGTCALFPLYTSFKKRSARFSRNMQIAGLVLCVAIITVGHIFLNQHVTVQRRGIIIFLLAFLYLFGSTIWYLTRNSLKTRFGIFVGIIIFALITISYNIPSIAYANPNIRWWFNIEYIYFLIILLPATFIGDRLHKKMELCGNIYGEINGVIQHIFFPGLLAIVAYTIYGVYMRQYWCTLAVTAAGILMLGLLLKEHLVQYRIMFFTAGILIICGLVMDPVNGGLKKVPCTVQYCLLTCGLSTFLLMFSDYVCKHIGGGLLVKTFSGAGQNPLLSYIAFDSLVVPFMNITGTIAVYRAMYPQGIVMLGVLRAAVMVFFTMWLISLLSRKKIFWKA